MKSNPARAVGAAPRDPGDGEPGGQLLTARLRPGSYTDLAMSSSATHRATPMG